MDRITPLFCIVLLAGCPPAGGSDGTSDRGTGSVEAGLTCATAAFQPEGFGPPLAVVVELDPETGEGTVAVGAAHPDSEGVRPEPEQLDEASFELALDERELSLQGEGFSLSAARLSSFAGPMFLGQLDHEELGEHEVVCWAIDFAGDFAYDPETGVCEDGEGGQGWNAFPLAYTRETGDGQCGIWWGLMLNEDNLGYPTFTGMDLRGAQLGGASLSFANILDSNWAGADLTGFEFGYARLSGTVDRHTRLREESCELSGDRLECMR